MSRVIPMSHINAFFANKKLRSPFVWNAVYLRLKKGALFKKDLSLSVSRVLSCTVIYLGLPSPISSSDVHGIPSDGQPYWRKPNLAASGVYMAYCVTTISVSSYLAFPSLPHVTCGGLFLLHYPWSRLHLTLSGTLSYAARTFLMTQRAPRPYNKLKFFLLLSDRGAFFMVLWHT